jgi:hypothetical protein
MSNLIISDLTIRQDAEGRYSLNDLHKAAVATGITKDIRPNEWMALDQTRNLVEILITENPGNKPIDSKAGRYGGTYVVKELVYAYGMWISPAFHLKVIRAYDALVTQSSPTQSQYPKSRKALPGGLTLEQQDAVKALVRSRVEVLPKAKQGKAAITCWSSIKSKFGVKTYKEVPPEQFGEVLSLVARLPLEGEHIPAGQPDPAPEKIPPLRGRVLLMFENGQVIDSAVLPIDAVIVSGLGLAALRQGIIEDNTRALARLTAFCEEASAGYLSPKTTGN